MSIEIKQVNTKLNESIDVIHKLQQENCVLTLNKIKQKLKMSLDICFYNLDYFIEGFSFIAFLFFVFQMF